LTQLFNFMVTVMDNPFLLMNCNLRPKNRDKKIRKVFQIIRAFWELDTQAIRTNGLKGEKHLLTMSMFNFKRSFEEISCFTCSSSEQKCYLALFVNRRLQVYDYISNKLLFELKVPNGGAFNQGSNITFLDWDNIIMIQDGHS
jgi:hypothetical protein